jgi:hypothetical protein
VTGGHAVSRGRPTVSLPDVLQVSLSLSGPITESELRPSAPDGESSRTGTAQRVECCGDMMISRRGTLILPLPLPSPSKRVQRENEGHEHGADQRSTKDRRPPDLGGMSDPSLPCLNCRYFIEDWERSILQKIQPPSIVPFLKKIKRSTTSKT